MTATPSETAKKAPVSGSIDQSLKARLEEIRWSRRLNKFSDVVAEALQEYADKHAPLEAADTETAEATGDAAPEKKDAAKKA